MKIVLTETLFSRGSFPRSKNWLRWRKRIHAAIRAVDWPPGAGNFSIYPEKGKKRGMGNGVKPIKSRMMKQLESDGWTMEASPGGKRSGLGPLDAVLQTPKGSIAVEWETGNISSSHRALNKMAVLMIGGALAAGVLIVPSRELCQYLTDRVGNYNELKPYFPLWSAIQCGNGVLEIVVIEHDAESFEAPRIEKATDGRALG